MTIEREGTPDEAIDDMVVRSGLNPHKGYGITLKNLLVKAITEMPDESKCDIDVKHSETCPVGWGEPCACEPTVHVGQLGPGEQILMH